MPGFSASMDRAFTPGLPRTPVRPFYFSDPAVFQGWQYESRRVAQLIDTNLWLGPMSSAKDEEFLTSNKIKRVLAVTHPRTWDIMKRSPSCEYSALLVAGTDGLVNIFSQARLLIEDTKDNDGAVLVCCETGNEKAAAVVAAYLMDTYNWTVVAAVQHVQSRRLSIALDNSMKYHLQTYETLCQARSDVSSSTASTSHRRTIDDLYDDDDETAEAMDLNRGGIAPFNDNDNDSEVEAMTQ
ncbi:protein-tyrosine phosphatase-like protein [Limtongia smithiae]|uniref:protein-tyrosine phosphatase-like protein n=1 Tax=Limtongia smithiae TaxID=1125753 RepID=UPI0034CE9626